MIQDLSQLCVNYSRLRTCFMYTLINKTPGPVVNEMPEGLCVSVKSALSCSVWTMLPCSLLKNAKKSTCQCHSLVFGITAF